MYQAIYRGAAATNAAMSRVYANMSLAVLTSMFVSYLVGSNPALLEFFFTGILKWLVIFSPLAAILLFSFLQERLDRPALQLFLHGFAALMGLSFATIFAVYTMGSIATAFLGASVLFATMSLYGYFTKRSLDTLGQYLFVGLIAVLIASVINIFIGSTLFQMVISAISIIVFLGLTAYDTQKIREIVSYNDNGRSEIIGALTLYLNFINLFLQLLNLFGNRKG